MIPTSIIPSPRAPRPSRTRSLRSRIMRAAGGAGIAVLATSSLLAPAAHAAEGSDITNGGRLSSVPTGSDVPQGIAIGSIGGKELTQVDSVDPEKYVGKWYQVAAIPQPYTLQCFKNTTAEYGVKDSTTISVKNSCETIFNNRSSIEGQAKIKDTKTNASLTVAFNGVPFQNPNGPVNYRINYLAKDYSLAIVGDPARRSGFVLSRTPQLTAEQWKTVKAQTTAAGWWNCAFLTTPQKGGLQTIKPVCAL
ncbi:lipocalin family protein [uncultured Corynebacterium sp.]|uniref:lipocalin family protein n=1 Tax=uncultured Corynebacterium sp. TaxID=159447 RepID=UPI0025E560F2|nr:lipocalin family protein [uncultured Corynebacterium sp.]